MNDHGAPDHQRPIWATAMDLFGASAGLLISIAIIDTLVGFAVGWADGIWLYLLTLLLLLISGTITAYALHISELAGKHFGPSDLLNGSALPNREFIKITLLVICVLLLTILVFLGLLFISDSADGDELTTAELLALGTIGLGILSYVYFLCRCGTVFPAAAIDGDWSIRRAYKRGRGNSASLFRGLLVGPVLGLYAMNRLERLASKFGIDTLPWLDTGEFSLAGMIAAPFFSLGYSFITALGVVVFCNAYRKAKAQAETYPN